MKNSDISIRNKAWFAQVLTGLGQQEGLSKQSIDALLLEAIFAYLKQEIVWEAFVEILTEIVTKHNHALSKDLAVHLKELLSLNSTALTKQELHSRLDMLLDMIPLPTAKGEDEEYVLNTLQLVASYPSTFVPSLSDEAIKKILISVIVGYFEGEISFEALATIAGNIALFKGFRERTGDTDRINTALFQINTLAKEKHSSEQAITTALEEVFDTLF